MYIEEPIKVHVCARKEVCGAPEVGARDQYIPDAGAGGTSGAVLGSGSGGCVVCGPREGRWMGVVVDGREVVRSGGAGEEDVDVV